MKAIKQVPFTFKKRGIFYFQKQVPSTLRHLYSSNRISMSLRTTDANEAAQRAAELSKQLESYWLQVSFQERFTNIAGLLPNNGSASAKGESATPLLSDVKALYLKTAGSKRSKRFHDGVERAFKLLMNLKGDKPIASYTRTDANKIRDQLLAKGLAPQSVQRTFTTLSAAFNLTINELDLELRNIFHNFRFGQMNLVRERKPFDSDSLRLIQARCKQEDSEMSQLLALISDTGLRLSEAVGLTTDDIVLTDTPHINLVEHAWRTLKTSTSVRKVPLVGASLWAASKISQRAHESQFAFPKYCNENTCKSSTASVYLNKWLQQLVNDRSLVVHSFRHSMRDRLRAIECPPEMIDQIGGWLTKGVGVSYGSGYPIENLHDWMKRIVIK